MSALYSNTERGKKKDAAPPRCGTAQMILGKKNQTYFRRKGLESSPPEFVRLNSAIPRLPSGTTVVTVPSLTCVNFARLPGPKETPLMQPASPKFSPVSVILSPVLPSSGETFLIFGVTLPQTRSFATLSAPEAFVL